MEDRALRDPEDLVDEINRTRAAEDCRRRLETDPLRASRVYGHGGRQRICPSTWFFICVTCYEGTRQL